MKKTVLIFVIALSLIGVSCSNDKSGSKSANDTLVADSVVADANLYKGPKTEADTFSYRGYAMLADILAGKMPADPEFMKAVTSDKAFATHSSIMTDKWKNYKADKVDKIRAWSKENLAAKADTVFYPFGGPDFNYLSSFFPDARFSVLIGMEKPGRVPLATEKSQARGGALLTDLRESVISNMRSSFFVTANMAKDLATEVQGTLPVVLMFMSMHGFEVLTVNPVEITEEGEIVYTEPDKVWAHTLDKKFKNGYEVMYRLPGENGARRFNYFSLDLSNGGFKRNHLDKMAEKYFNGHTTFLKAASYLLHQGDFTNVRNSILENCNRVVTGPSGMPYKAFDKNKWDITLYGEWNPPYKAFSTLPQNDLKAAYDKSPKHPINFRYDYAGGKGFFVAEKKK